jgi:hypothetical protein
MDIFHKITLFLKGILHPFQVKKTTFLPLKRVKYYFKVMNFY